MASAAPTARTYLATYGWLLALTAVEVGVVMAGAPQRTVVAVLLAAAAAKAWLIAMIFMHLKFERRTVWLLPGLTLLLAAFFVAMLFPDLVWHQALRH
jgi:heme/copper-type cytochrome/quinol oxidase subunit 4